MYKISSIFEEKNNEIVINEHILLIPCLKAIKDYYKDPLPPLKFLRYRFDIKGPYADEPEEEKDEILMKEFPGEYTLEDEVMVKAIEWFESKKTAVQRYYLDHKALMERLGAAASSGEITYGRDGNFAAMQRQLASVGKTILEFRELEKVVEEELVEMSKTKNRGEHQSGYDEQ